MYLNTIALENFGPIDSLRIETKTRARRVDDDAFGMLLRPGEIPHTELAPAPIILVGENGSGKTMTLATVADALYELGTVAFQDVLPKSGLGHSYFKVR